MVLTLKGLDTDVDVVHLDFVRVMRRTSEDSIYHYDLYRNYAKTHGGVGFLKGDPTYAMNRPHEGYCVVHQRFCKAVMTHEVSRREDFGWMRHWILCPDAVNALRLEGRFVRKWQVDESTMYRGEENALYDDFCYWHMAREGRRLQTREYVGDIFDGVLYSPMCDEAEEEIARKGWYVRPWSPFLLDSPLTQ